MTQGKIEKINHDPSKKYIGIKMEGVDWANCFDEETVEKYKQGFLKQGDMVEYELSTKGKWTNIRLLGSIMTADQLPREQETLNPTPIQASIPQASLEDSFKEASTIVTKFLEENKLLTPTPDMQLDCITRMGISMFIQRSR